MECGSPHILLGSASLRVMTRDETRSDGVRPNTKQSMRQSQLQREDHLLQAMLDRRAMMMSLAGRSRPRGRMGIQGMEQGRDGPYKISYHYFQNKVQFKTYTLLIYGIFPLIFSYYG